MKLVSGVPVWLCGKDVKGPGMLGGTGLVKALQQECD